MPVDTINRAVPLILRGRSAMPRAALGVRLTPDSVVARLGWRGALVGELVPGGGAETAGLRATEAVPQGGIRFGDLIVGVDGRRVGSGEELRALLADREPGERVELELLRDPAGRAEAARVQVELRSP